MTSITWIGPNMRTARLKRGWSQAELAARLGRTQTAVSYWEAGKRLPGLDDLVDLAGVFEVSADELLQEPVEGPPIAALLRAETARLASDEFVEAVDRVLELAATEAPAIGDITVEATGSPTHAAHELLDKANVVSAPVPVEELAARCGAIVMALDFPDALSGLLVSVGGGAVIGVNTRHAEVRQRFSAAHELGHLILDHADQFHIDVTDGHPPGHDYRSERAANEFAADLLMPRRILAPAYATSRSPAELARDFQVSEIAMGYRLVNLGLR